MHSRKFVSCLLCLLFTLSISFSLMSVTVAAADDEAPTVNIVPSAVLELTQNIPIVVRSTRLINNVVTPTIYTVGSMSYVGTFNSSALTHWDNSFFGSYKSMSGYVLLYEYSFPSDIVVSYADVFTITADMSSAFNDLEYIEFFCGFAFERSYGRNLSCSTYPNNYLSCSSADASFNGHVKPFVPRPEAANPWWGEFCWNFPGSIAGQENPIQLCFVDNHISYNSSTTPVNIRVNSITANLPPKGYLLDGLNHFYFAIGGPVVSENGTYDEAPETVDDILAVTEEQRQLLINIQVALESEDSLMGQILAALQALLSAVNTGVLYDIDLTLHRIEALMPSGGGGSGGGMTGDEFKGLFVMDKDDIAEISHDWNAMWNTYFPAMQEVETTIQDTTEDILSADNVEAVGSLSLPSLEVEGNTVIPSLEMPLKPTGFEDFFDLLKIIIDIVVTFAFINGLRHRFDKTVLEDDA